MSPATASFDILAPQIALGSSGYRAERRPAAQPPPVVARRVTIVADVRLDNRDELCRKLDLRLSTTDVDVLAAAWARWGSSLVDHLVGGFAFACWDKERQALFLARDHVGERPLHFTRAGGPAGGFAFASMPLALCALPTVGHGIDVAYMAQFLAMTAPRNNQTFFRRVEKLPPGHCLKVTPDGIEVRRYWHPIDAKQIRYQRDDDYIEDFRERMDRAVAVHLVGTSGVATGLSGGLDSSTVTATAARLLAVEQRRLTSFTSVPLPEYDGYAPPGRYGDEGQDAADVAAMYPNIDHIRVDASGRDLLAATTRASQLSGEPTLNPTNELWIGAILDGMRSRGLGVLLEGAAGNLTISFGGLIALSELFRRGRWLTLFRRTRELRAGGYTSWRGATSWATGSVMPQWIRRAVHPELRDFSLDFSAVHPDRVTEYALKDRVLETFFGAEDSTDAVRRQLYESYDPGVSNGAVAAGWQIEQRDPTHDKRIYEFCLGIPVEQYLVGGQNRSIVRRAMKGRLPEATLRRTLRGLQAADWYLVMGQQRAQLAAELRRIEGSPLARHLLDTARMKALLEDWPTSNFHDTKVNETWHLALSRGIAAGSFLAQYDPDAVQPDAVMKDT